MAEISNLLQNSQRLKEIKTVVLSGGEPFLRQDIVDICAQIKKSLPHVSIGILTNALDSENILLKSKLIAEIFSPSSFWLGTSLDGLAGIYDRIRGIEGGFVRFLKTVRDLKSELPAVRLSATFVLTSFNIDQLIPCWDFSQEHNLDFFAQFGVDRKSVV